ncbi:MAG: UDP-N-acetylglucosamine 2-epimerase, partial [Cyclobacteriaceae bacterium]|nr:UDP-N-acetylglucosamine 2-epimerase [Cyclobacteriaceae bacterium]
MRIGVLTSSRADFGIYLPLIKALDSDEHFNLSLIVFGAHLSKEHGYTITEILEMGFSKIQKLCPLEFEDSPAEIGKSIGHITSHFASYWENHKEVYDVVFCLGDRFEMFAAVVAGVPFGIRFAHIHGGETTLGAIDNVFRHSITLYSTIHFTSTENY